MSRYEECKKARVSAKSQVTKSCNRICQLIAEGDDYSSVPELVSKLKQNFAEFTSVHDQVVSKESDENVEHDKYFDEVQCNYVNALCKAKSIMHTNTTVIGQSDNDDFNLLSLPKVELEVFTGDPLKYHAFIKSFAVKVERLCKDPDSSLARLLQYTAGDAHQSIQIINDNYISNSTP